MSQPEFLPMTPGELVALGVEQPDFVLVTGDAYVDHPSFANALLGRYMTALGYSVAILAQPDPKKKESFCPFPTPRLGFLVSPGNMDSMVRHYSASKGKRKKDAYSPGGRFLTPPRAAKVYCSILRELYPDSPIIVGGIEASLRRFAHYDYWEDKVVPSLLLNCPADLLVYGMGEHPLQEIAEALDSGLCVRDITYVRGTCWLADSPQDVYDDKVVLPSFDKIREDKRAYAKAFAAQYKEQNPFTGKTLVQPHGDKCLVQNPPALPLSREELDFVHSLPYQRRPHPSYKEPIAALAEVSFSLTSNRGCFGECAFCAIFFHQGGLVTSRSGDSLVEEATALTKLPGFKGYIHDVGGPTANFTQPPCPASARRGVCTHRRCLAPKPCPNLQVDEREYIENLRRIRQIPGIKRVFIRSGVRFDYALLDRQCDFVKELALHHTSGELKTAPEHVAPRVLRLMGKPGPEVHAAFVKRFRRDSERAGKKQYILPYYISSHPGCRLEDAVKLAEALKKDGFVPDQVQDFYPTPGSAATCMYYTGLDPFTMEQVYVPRSREERAMQRALLQYNKAENYPLVKKALRLCHREDLIGTGPRCLIRG